MAGLLKAGGIIFGPGIFAGFDNCSHAIIPVRDLARGIREEATLTTLISLSNACHVLG